MITGEKARSRSYYYRARYYDPKIGRFISEDPLPISGRARDELNAYGYVANNPVNAADPFGLAKLCCRPARRGFGGCHCFIGLEDGTALGAYRFGIFLQPLNDYKDDRPFPPPPCSRTNCSNIPLTPAQEREIRREHRTMMVNGPTFYGLDGTSNRPVQDLLTPYGISLPSCAFGATPPD